MRALRAHRRTLLLLLLAGSAVFLRVYNLGFPDGRYFDEVHYASSARHLAGVAERGDMQVWERHPLVGRSPDGNFYHPPFGKLLYAGAVRLLGDRPAAMRAVSALAGLLSLAIFHLVARELLADDSLALAASFAYSASFLQIVHSRIVMLDVLGLLSGSLAVLAALRLRKGALDRRWVAVAALSLGAAVSVKYSNALVCGVFAAIVLVKSELPWRRALALLAGLAATTLLAALAGSAWYVAQGFSFGEWLELRRIGLGMLSSTLHPHRYVSSPLQWLYDYRAIWYHFEALGGGRLTGIVGLLNPVICFGFVAALPVLLANRIGRLGYRDVAILAWFGLTYLPLFYVLRERQGFIYYMLPSVPAMCLCTVRALSDALSERWSRRLAWLYAGLCLAAVAAFLPVLIGLPFGRAYYDLLVRVAPP